MKKHLIFKDDKSDKFWKIETSGTSYTVTYGKAGTDGQTSTKEFDTEEKCVKEAEKLVSEKLKKGYTNSSKENISGEALQQMLSSKLNQQEEYKLSEKISKESDFHVRVMKDCFNIKIEISESEYWLTFSMQTKGQLSMISEGLVKPKTYREASNLYVDVASRIKDFIMRGPFLTEPELKPEPDIASAICINIWDDYPDDGEPGQTTSAYIEEDCGLGDKATKEILKIVFNRINEIKPDKTEIILRDNEIEIRNLTHKQREVLVKKLGQETLTYQKIPIKVYSES